MSSNPGAKVDIPDELAKPLEESLTHLVDHSDAHAGSGKDQLARKCDRGFRHGIDVSASEKRADAIHSHGSRSKGWISKFWPSEQTLDKVGSAEGELTRAIQLRAHG